jgi:uncharacterized membrane protein
VACRSEEAQVQTAQQHDRGRCLDGAFAHYGIDEGFIDQVRSKITPGTSALFLLSSGAVVYKVADAVKGQQFEIIQTNLSKEQEEKLREDFGE